MTHRGVRYTLLGLELFTGIMALYGGVSLLIDAAGFGLQEEWLNGSPFSNYQMPAMALLIFIGGGSLLAAALLWMRHTLALPVSTAVGAALMIFEVVETYSIGLRSFQQPLMFVIGFAVAALAAWMWFRDNSGPLGRLTLHSSH